MKYSLLFLSIVLVTSCGGSGSAGSNSNEINVADEIIVDGNNEEPLFGLNDTGILIGANDTSGINSTCLSNMMIEQDCHQGRDALDAKGHLIKAGQGSAGFDFTKIDDDGNELSASASDWSCVRDNRTGLIWEVKKSADGTAKDNLHDADDLFTFRSQDLSIAGASFEDNNCFGYEIGYPSTYCNTSAFIQRVNDAGLCGIGSWRLPYQEELRSLVHYGAFNPAIDIAYFPSTQDEVYRSNTVEASANEFTVVIDFSSGSDTNFYKSRKTHVRLVSSGESGYSELSINSWDNNRYEINGNGTVVDKVTGLIWKQCSEGKEWYITEKSNFNACSGDITPGYTWKEALKLANDSVYAGYNDWRLPNIKELATIVSFDDYAPAVNSFVFPGTSKTEYWSSTPVADYILDERSQAIDFEFGFDRREYRNRLHQVRLVRSPSGN